MSPDAMSPDDVAPGDVAPGDVAPGVVGRGPIFVVGVARSGTTLLSAMLSAHSRLDCGPESRFFARYRHLDGAQRSLLTDPETWPDLAIDFISSLENQGHPIVDLFDLPLEDVRAWLARRPPSVPAMLESLVVQHAERRGKVRWVEKTPRHLLMLDSLRGYWPDADIVLIVRDPRDVALSLAAMPFAGESLVGNLVRIDQDDRASRAFLAGDPRVLSLRYEDLVTEPERELRRLCAFLGEEYEPGMLDPRRAAAGVAAEHEWWKRSVAGPLDPSRAGRWRQQMPADVQRFAALHLASFIREHGYDGARAAARSVAIIPVADAVGARHDALLLQLAENDAVVTRPSPERLADLRSQERLVFFGIRGQLDPFWRRRALGRSTAIVGLAALLAVRRLQRRPALWVRRLTNQRRRPRDPGEVVVAGSLRLLARAVRPSVVPDLVRSRPQRGGASPAPPDA